MTCRHCGKPIDREKTGFWVHTGKGNVKCDPADYDGKMAQP